MEQRIAIRGIAFQDNQLLAQKFRTYEGGETDYWGTPGGGIDPGETHEECLHREMVEETGIAPKIGRLLFTQQFKMTREDGKEREHLEYFYHIENPLDFLQIDLNATTHGVHELTRCEYVNPAKEYILPAFLQTLNIAEYINTAQPARDFNYLDD